MASISKDRGRDGKLNGCRTIQFVSAEGKRRSVRLGKVTQRNADNVKQYVESVLSANSSGDSYERATAEWISRIEPKMYAKFADAGLLPKRKAREDSTLGKFTDRFIKSRQSLKPMSLYMLKYCRRTLVEFFGADKPMAEITKGDADDYRQHLAKTMAENTVRTHCNRGRQFFVAAIKHELVERNPFAGMPNLRQLENRDRARFVSMADTEKIIAKLADPEMRLIVALSRYGGLRIPSEPLAMKWGDIDRERNRITVHCVKTERHEGKATRVIPLFPEIVPHLDAVYGAAEDGTELLSHGNDWPIRGSSAVWWPLRRLQR